MRSSSRTALRLGLVIGGLIFGIVAVELVFRALGIGSPTDNSELVLTWDPPDPFQAVADPAIGFIFRPGYRGRTVYQRASDGEVVRSVSVIIGERGLRLRGPPEELPAAYPSAPRVLVVGDSVSFGLGVEADEAWPAALERRLDAGEVVLSAGVPGWNTAQMSTWLEQEGWSLNPSLTLLAFYMNDLMPAARVDAGADTRPSALTVPPWARREAGFRRQSWLYNQIWRVYERERLARTQLMGHDRSYLEELSRTFHAPTLERYYVQLARACERRQTRCAVVILPFFEGVPDDTARSLLDRVEAVAKQANIAAIRVDTCLDDLELARRIVMPGERHASAEANTRIGDAVAEGLRRQGIWP